MSTDLSVPQAAELAKCSVGRIRQMLIAGELAGRKLNRRAWIVDRNSVYRYAKQLARKRQGK